jgi:hypothetical protein
VKGEEDDDYPWIAKVKKVFSDGRPKLQLLWTYHPYTLGFAAELDFGTREILLSNHEDIIDTDCLMGFTEVEENCKDCKEPEHWCWNKKYNVLTRKINSRPTKRRRVGG